MRFGGGGSGGCCGDCSWCRKGARHRSSQSRIVRLLGRYCTGSRRGRTRLQQWQRASQRGGSGRNECAKECRVYLRVCDGCDRSRRGFFAAPMTEVETAAEAAPATARAPFGHPRRIGPSLSCLRGKLVDDGSHKNPSCELFLLLLLLLEKLDRMSPSLASQGAHTTLDSAHTPTTTMSARVSGSWRIARRVRLQSVQ